MARTRREAVNWPTILRELTVIDVVDVSATTRRITLSGDQLAKFEVAGGTAAAFATEGFDDHVKLLVPLAGTDRPPLPVQGPDRLEWGGAGGRPVAKDYTPRRFRPANGSVPGELELDFVLHPGGFAAEWARRVTPGELAWVVGPTRSLLLPTGVEHLVFAADETALPAVGRLLESWSTDVSADVVVNVPGEDSEQDLVAPESVNLIWAHGTTAWLDEVRRLTPVIGSTFCWFAGESAAVRELRRFATTDWSVPRDCLDATGYWRT